MYGGMGGGDFTTVVTGATATTAGALALPATSGNTIGTILAVTAIAIGALAITSQVVVRVVRRLSK